MKYIITEEQFSTIRTKNPNSIIKKIKNIYNSMVMEGICDVDLFYDEEDDNLYCYLVVDRDWYLNDSEEKTWKNIKIRKYVKEFKEKIKNYLGVTTRVGTYVNNSSCES